MQSLCLLLALLAVQSCVAVPDAPYYGLKIGDFSMRDHSLSGQVYVVDAHRIRIRDLVYDGKAPAAVFWIGERDKHSEKVSANGREIPDENGSTAILKEYKKADIVLTLPNDVSVNNIMWLSMWCKKVPPERANFGEVYFPENMTVPRVANLGPFSTISNGVRSLNVTVLDSKIINVMGINYDGKGTDVFFVAGNDTTLSSPNGLVKIPRHNSQLQPLQAFVNEDVQLILPQHLTVYNIHVISVYSFKTSQNFGHINITLGNFLVPPHTKSLVDPDGNESEGDKAANSANPTSPLSKWYNGVLYVVLLAHYAIRSI